MYDEELMQKRGNAEVLSCLLKVIKWHLQKLCPQRAAQFVAPQKTSTSGLQTAEKVAA